MPLFDVIKDWIRQITEVGLLLVALIIVVQILFGEAWFAAGDVVENLLGIIKSFGDNGNRRADRIGDRALAVREPKGRLTILRSGRA